MLEDVNDEIPLFTEREQETVLEGEPIGTKVTQVNAIDKDGTFPSNRKFYDSLPSFNFWLKVKTLKLKLKVRLRFKSLIHYMTLVRKFIPSNRISSFSSQCHKFY